MDAVRRVIVLAWWWSLLSLNRAGQRLVADTCGKLFYAERSPGRRLSASSFGGCNHMASSTSESHRGGAAICVVPDPQNGSSRLSVPEAGALTMCGIATGWAWPGGRWVSTPIAEACGRGGPCLAG